MTQPISEVVEELERLLEKATPQNIDTAEIKEDGAYECPWCNGQGEVEGSTYINYDDVASNVQFSGIGAEFGHAEALFRAVVKHLPLLLAEIKRGREALEKTLAIMDVADNLLDRDTEEQIRKVFHYDPPDDAEILISGKTYFAILAVFEHVETFRKLIAAAAPRELPKEWCRESAQIEGDSEIGAGPLARAALEGKDNG